MNDIEAGVSMLVVLYVKAMGMAWIGETWTIFEAVAT